MPLKKERKKIQRKNTKDLKTSAEKGSLQLPIFDEDLASIFPPVPLDKTLSHRVITAACKKFEPKLFEEHQQHGSSIVGGIR